MAMLKSVVAIVSGGGSGLGSAVAKRIVAAGGRVIGEPNMVNRTIVFLAADLVFTSSGASLGCQPGGRRARKGAGSLRRICAGRLRQ